MQVARIEYVDFASRDAGSEEVGGDVVHLSACASRRRRSGLRQHRPAGGHELVRSVLFEVGHCVAEPGDGIAPAVGQRRLGDHLRALLALRPTRHCCGHHSRSRPTIEGQPRWVTRSVVPGFIGVDGDVACGAQRERRLSGRRVVGGGGQG